MQYHRNSKYFCHFPNVSNKSSHHHCLAEYSVYVQYTRILKANTTVYCVGVSQSTLTSPNAHPHCASSVFLSPVLLFSPLLMSGFWRPSASQGLKQQVSCSCYLRLFPSKLSSPITASRTLLGQTFSGGILAPFLKIRFNQDVFFLLCFLLLFKNVILTRRVTKIIRNLKNYLRQELLLQCLSALKGRNKFCWAVSFALKKQLFLFTT